MPPSQAITRDQLREYFHLPINEVAKRLGVCATVLKKICRKNGVPRWPHRKIRSLKKMIAALEESVPRSKEDAQRIKQEIETLQSKKQFIINNPAVLALKPTGITKDSPIEKPNITLDIPVDTSDIIENDSKLEFSTDPSQLLCIQKVFLMSLQTLYNDKVYSDILGEVDRIEEDTNYPIFKIEDISPIHKIQKPKIITESDSFFPSWTKK